MTGEPGARDDGVSDSGSGAPETRRDFLQVAALSFAAVGACACVWPLLDSLSPEAPAPRAAAPLAVPLDDLAPGTQRVVAWRGLPILVLHRTPDEIASLRAPALLARLLDPASDTDQQPAYARNWYRSIDPRYGVYVGICTHLGCIPALQTDLYRCPCHGSGFDLAGRVLAGSPARLNLPVPPYAMADARSLLLGAADSDPGYDLDKVDKL